MSSTFNYIVSRPRDKSEVSRISTLFITITPVRDEYKSLIKCNTVPIKDQCCVLYTNLVFIIVVEYDVID